MAAPEFWHDWDARTFTFPGEEKVDGYHRGNDWMLSTSESRFLAYLATKAPENGHIVEIGSWSAKSTCYLAQVAKNLGRPPVFSIDLWHLAPWHDESTWGYYVNALRNLDLADAVIPITADSRKLGQTWIKPISLLFIDGDHSYEGCLSDYKLFAPHVVKGGIIAFHDYADYHYPDVARVIHEHVVPSPDWIDHSVFADPAGIWFARRR